MSKVFVLDTHKRALDPVHPGWARKLLSSGQAAVFRRYPFTIMLKKEVSEPVIQPLRLKLDPGSKTTGIAIVNDASGEVVFAAELSHRGQQIKASLEKRRAVRRSRRQRQTRYRKTRCDNRKRPEGWLAPSLMSRVYNIETWVRRLLRVCPIVALSQERVKFDLQRMDNPAIAGVEYQQGTLYGYELREYLLEKCKRQCAYCDATGVPLQIEHVVCRARHGPNRVSNLTLACEPCNIRKGTQDSHEFLRHDPVRLACILTHAKAPLLITAKGHGSRQMCRMDKFGFPRTGPKQARRVRGFQTGDIVRAAVPAGKKQGAYVGRVAVRTTGSFNLTTIHGTVEGISHRHCTALHRCDGYAYVQTRKGVAFPPAP